MSKILIKQRCSKTLKKKKKKLPKVLISQHISCDDQLALHFGILLKAFDNNFSLFHHFHVTEVLRYCIFLGPLSTIYGIMHDLIFLRHLHKL